MTQETTATETADGQEPENVETPEATDETETPNAEDAEQTGGDFDGEFDPARARQTINRLRAEEKKLKQELADAKKPTPAAPDPALQLENLQLSVALQLGIPKDLALRLRGTTEEELIADADALIAQFERKPAAPARVTRTGPKGGTTPSAEPEKSPRDIAAGIRLS
ncbi:hypothetical protein M2390_002932 [Mycetocola sp. BIGb0189]|uniref:hypothetical protein n=1 Tax=Mycetocola sp. BIGb0189 TaxID=2940604 RepID=UPI002168FC4E|nr:hypothetical protein [Mycetocola sp. BIGb0189]MCS4277723.1 hypothetical protein [Mycetocola sp. BIGb0189]